MWRHIRAPPAYHTSLAPGVLSTRMAEGFFSRRTFCIVTGASQGLGREIAMQLSQGWCKAGVSSDVVILARSVKGLEETKARIDPVTPGVTVHFIPADLGELHSAQSTLAEAAKFADPAKHQQFVLVHNAGTMSDITQPAIQQSDPAVIQEYLALNFTSMFVLTSHFLSTFSGGHRTIINISSILAQKPYPGFSLYGSARAARNALMGTLAVENPDVRVLTYTPGPCDTDMTTFIREHAFAKSVRKDFDELYEKNTILSCAQSISKLVSILQEDKFENAAVIDYYD